MTVYFAGLNMISWSGKEGMDMREKLQRFMTGRYGADELGRTLNIVVLVSLVVSMFSGLLQLLSIC